MFPRSTVLALAIASIAATQAFANQAADTANQVTTEVQTNDLNLAAQADQQTLRHRIHYAAMHVCAAVTNGPGASDTGYPDCFRVAFADGWHQAEMKIAAAEARQMVASAAH